MGRGQPGPMRLHLPPHTHKKKIKHRLYHRYLRKVDCSSFVMCPLLPLALPRIFLQQPLTVLTRQTSQVVHAINQSIFNMMSMDCAHRYIREVDILVHEKPTSTKQNKTSSTNKAAGWHGRWAGWIDVPALTANVIVAATNWTYIQCKTGCAHHQSVYLMIFL